MGSWKPHRQRLPARGNGVVISHRRTVTAGGCASDHPPPRQEGFQQGLGQGLHSRQTGMQEQQGPGLRGVTARVAPAPSPASCQQDWRARKPSAVGHRGVLGGRTPSLVACFHWSSNVNLSQGLPPEPRWCAPAGGSCWCLGSQISPLPWDKFRGTTWVPEKCQRITLTVCTHSHWPHLPNRH